VEGKWMKKPYGIYELWFSEEDGDRLVAVIGVHEDHQKVLVGAERFGPFDNGSDVAAWLWKILRFELVGSLS
jgi:hypothetical protein